MNKIREQLREAMGWGRQHLERFSPGQRWLILGCTATFFLLLLLAGEMGSRSQLKTLRLQLKDREGKLEQVLALQGDYHAKQAQERELEQQLRASKNVRLVTLVENTAREFRLDIRDMVPREQALENNVTEESLELNLKKITLDVLTDFSSKLEHSGSLIKIKRLLIQARYDQAAYLDVSLTVSLFKWSGT